MYHTIAYFAAAAAAGASNVDFSFATDAVFTPRGSTPHLVLTVPMKLGRIAVIGASVTRGRFQSPTWQGILTQPDLFQVNRSATVPSNPQWDDWLDGPLVLPQNEEIQIQYSNNLGASTEVETAIIDLLSADWNLNRPPGVFDGIAEYTFAVTPTVQAWSGGQVLTAVTTLRNGVYSVMGAVVQGTNSIGYRIIFPTQKPYAGKFLRPGGLVQNAIGDVLSNQRDAPPMILGEMGRFHTFELPQAEVFGLTASSTTYRVFLWVRYLGTDPSLLYSWAGSGSSQTTL